MPQALARKARKSPGASHWNMFLHNQDLLEPCPPALGKGVLTGRGLVPKQISVDFFLVGALTVSSGKSPDVHTKMVSNDFGNHLASPSLRRRYNLLIKE